MKNGLSSVEFHAESEMVAYQDYDPSMCYLRFLSIFFSLFLLHEMHETMKRMNTAAPTTSMWV